MDRKIDWNLWLRSTVQFQERYVSMWESYWKYSNVFLYLDTTEGFLNYKSGVFYDNRCYNHTVDHAIVSFDFKVGLATG